MSHYSEVKTNKKLGYVAWSADVLEEAGSSWYSINVRCTLGTQRPSR
jgi:hypothetical protein